MKTIEIDDEVYAYLQSKAIAFVESPNQSIRRLLGLNKKESIPRRIIPAADRKKPKANLHELVSAGLLAEKQQVYLRDYRGQEISGCVATIFQGSLIWNEKSYSMSKLAKIFLKKQGYESEDVRGPAFWFTEDGVSIKNLWERYLKKNYDIYSNG